MRILSTISILVFCITGKLVAQHTNEDWSFYSRQKILEWNHSHPYLMASGFREFYQANLGYNYGEGDLHNVFAPSKFTTLQFNSQSQKSIGDWLFNGSFDYQKNFKSVRSYLLQSNDNIQNPYQLADINSGPWSGDRVNFSIGALSPLYIGITQSFLKVDYMVGSSNRNSEPRPLFRNNHIFIQFGQLVEIEDWLNLGVAAFYKQRKEENLIGNYATQDLQLYQFRGISTFSKNTFRSFQRNQQFDTYGIHLFSTINRRKYTSFIDISFAQGNFSARNAIVSPVDSGKLNILENHITVGNRIVLNEKQEWQFDLNIDYEKIEGTDPIFKAINYESEKQELTFSNLFLFKNKNQQLGANVSYSNDERLDLAGNDEIKYQFFETEASYLFPIKKIWNQNLYLKPMIGYRKAIHTFLSTSANGLLNEIRFKELEFVGADYLKGALELEWKMALNQQSLFINSKITRNQSEDIAYSSFHFKLGLIF